MSVRRAVRRVCLSGAAAVVLLALVAPGPSAQVADPEVGRPLAWEGLASATGVHWVASPRSGIAVFPELIRGDVSEGASQFNASGTADARASILYPGAGVTGTPTLICSQGFDQAPGPACTTPYPLTAEASYPSRTDAELEHGQGAGGEGAPAGFGANKAVAHADREFVSTEARVSNLTVAGGPQTAAAALDFRRTATSLLLGPVAAASVRPAQTDTAALHVEDVVARTRQEFEGSTLIVSASARLDGVALAGGTVFVDSIEATSVSRKEPGKLGVTVSSVDVGNVTVAGQPARIGHDGITITGSGAQGGPVLDTLNGALDQALDASDTDVRLIGATQAADGETTDGQAAGLLYETSADLSAVPQFGSVYSASALLGSAGTSAYASEALQTDDGSLVEGDIFGESAGPAPGGGGPLVPAAPVTDPQPAAEPEERQPAPPEAPPAEGDVLSSLLGGLAAERLQLLYLAFALGFLGLCIAPPAFVPARLPVGAGS